MCVCVCLRAVKLARRPAAKYRKFPNNRTTGGETFKKAEAWNRLSLISACLHKLVGLKSQTVNFYKLHISFHNTHQIVLMFSAWMLVMRRKNTREGIIWKMCKWTSINRCRISEWRWFDLKGTNNGLNPGSEEDETLHSDIVLRLKRKQSKWIWLNIYTSCVARWF